MSIIITIVLKDLHITIFQSLGVIDRHTILANHRWGIIFLAFYKSDVVFMYLPSSRDW